MTTKGSVLWLDGLGVGSAEAVLTSAFVGGVVALAVVRRHRTIAKKEKAYEVAGQFLREERVEAEAKLRAMARTKNWETVIGSEEKIEAETRQQVFRCLNEWELMCIGIRQNIVHEGVLKDAIGDRLVIIHMAAKGLIAEIRQDRGDMEFYEHFEYIAGKWTANPRNLWRSVREWISWKMGGGGR